MIRIMYFFLGFGVAWGIALIMIMKRQIEREKFLKQIGWLPVEDKNE